MAGFDSQTQHHMWVEFVVGSCSCSKGFSPGSPVFLPPQKPTLLKANLIWNQWKMLATVNSYLFIYLFIYYSHLYSSQYCSIVLSIAFYKFKVFLTSKMFFLTIFQWHRLLVKCLLQSQPMKLVNSFHLAVSDKLVISSNVNTSWLF